MNGDGNFKEIYAKITELEIDIAELKTKFDGHKEYTSLAGEKFETMLDGKLEALNNVRIQLDRQASTFMTSDTYNAGHRILEVKIEAMQKIVYGALAVVSFLVFAIPILLHFIG